MAARQVRVDFLRRHGLARGEYVLATLHRAENTESPKILRRRLRVVAEAERTSDLMQQWAKQAYIPWPGTLDEFFAYIKKEGEEVGADFKRVGVKPIQN